MFVLISRAVKESENGTQCQKPRVGGVLVKSDALQ